MPDQSESRQEPELNRAVERFLRKTNTLRMDGYRYSSADKTELLAALSATGVTQDDGTTKSDSVSSGLVDAAAQDVERLATDVLERMRRSEHERPRDWQWWTGRDGPTPSEIKMLAAALTSSPHDRSDG